MTLLLLQEVEGVGLQNDDFLPLHRKELTNNYQHLNIIVEVQKLYERHRQEIHIQLKTLYPSAIFTRCTSMPVLQLD